MRYSNQNKPTQKEEFCFNFIFSACWLQNEFKYQENSKIKSQSSRSRENKAKVCKFEFSILFLFVIFPQMSKYEFQCVRADGRAK